MNIKAFFIALAIVFMIIVLAILGGLFIVYHPFITMFLILITFFGILFKLIYDYYDYKHPKERKK